MLRRVRSLECRPSQTHQDGCSTLQYVRSSSRRSWHRGRSCDSEAKKVLQSKTHGASSQATRVAQHALAQLSASCCARSNVPWIKAESIPMCCENSKGL